MKKNESFLHVALGIGAASFASGCRELDPGTGARLVFGNGIWGRVRDWYLGTGFGSEWKTKASEDTAESPTA